MRKIFTLCAVMALGSLAASADTYMVKVGSRSADADGYVIKAGDVLETDGTAMVVTANYNGKSQNNIKENAKFSDGTLASDFGSVVIQSRLKTAPDATNNKGVPNADGTTSFNLQVKKAITNVRIYFEATGNDRKYKWFNTVTNSNMKGPANGEISTDMVAGGVSGNHPGFICNIASIEPGNYTLYQTGFSGGFIGILYEAEPDVAQAISYGEGTTTFTWGDAIEGLPVLSNESNLAVKYASSDVNVATIDDATGAVTVVGAGTTEISATAAAEGDAEPVVAKYTLVINKKKLAAPAITFDAATGLVTIGAVEGAEKVEYTVNGKEYNEYSEPFTVADGVTVAARAIVPNANFEATEASQRVLLASVEIEKPVISQFNGTFYVSCATPATKIMIKRGADEPVPFTRAITVEADETITAFATREGCKDSEAVTAEVKALPAVKTEKTIYLGHGSFDYVKNTDSEDGFSRLNGKSSGAEKDGYGFNLVLSGNNTKNWAKANAIKILGNLNATRTGIKGSNGAQFTLEIPKGLLVNRVTIYSFVNGDNNQSGWKEVNGVNYDNEVKAVPMGARAADAESNPDVRVFNFDGAHGSITFNNAGAQLVFVMAVDIVESMDAPVHGHGVDGTETEIELPSNTEIKLSHDDNDANIMWRWVGETANDPAGDAPEVEALAEETAPADGEWTNYNDKKPQFNQGKDMTLEFYAEKNGVKSETKNLLVKLAETVGIADINVDNANAPVEYFNLQGIRVDNPSNGIFIRRQGNEVSKVIIK